MKRLLFCVLMSTAIVGCTIHSRRGMTAMKAQLDSLLAGRALTGERLVKFDTLDFVVYSGQQWMRLHESHGANIRVYYPDGHTTVGIPDHIEELKKMFVFAPDTRIRQHPIAFGSGNYTAVTGIIEGTFTHPMPLGVGRQIPPTGKKFRLPMCTVGIWEGGVMVEEHLFYDNLSFMQQIGAL